MTMSLMSKLLTLSAISIAALSAQDVDMKAFIEKNILRGNPAVKINNIKTVQVVDVPGNKEWKAHMNLVNLTYRGKTSNDPMVIFINDKGGLATVSLIDTKTGDDLANTMRPTLPDDYYNKAHLVSGNENAKHKVVIFSDPQCPFCIKFVPQAFEDAKKKKDIALYYYHMPLTRLHPISGVLVRVMEVLQHQGKIDEMFKIYQLKTSYKAGKEKIISVKETDPQKVLDAIKKQLGIEIKLSDIEDEKIKKLVKDDKLKGESMMINGTPTAYVDSKFDSGRKILQELLK